jgi:hypothetical protein
MSYFTQRIIDGGIDAITNGAVFMFGDESVQRKIEQQQSVFEDREDITNVLSVKQLKDKEEGKPFTPDTETAYYRGTHYIRWGISTRLKGAYACYKAGDEMECIRYLLIAVGSICHALNWEKAAKYLNEQNTALFAIKKAEEAAGS